ncbi:hypothetical protein [Spirosoma sp.]|uniref:hypothetical protein n=1 Tax=Spirosoma sp. TaxID=1899569 RepID=UPI003B3B7603
MNRLLVVLLLSPLLCSAQTTIDTLHWSATRRLLLSDFHAPTHPGLGGSEFHYQIGYEVRPTSIWSQPVIESFCLMFRNLSWISETARNERTLVYNQLLFDLVEVHARQMKAKLIALGIDKNFKQKAKQIEYLTNSELGGEVNRFRSETGGGDDLPALQRWQRQVAKQLYDTPDLVTTYRLSKMGYGIFLNGGVALPTGPLAQIINASAGLGVGLEVSYRQNLLLAQTTMFGGTIQSGFTYQNQSWETGIQVSPIVGDLAIGRILTTKAHNRVIPYVGYRYFSIIPRDHKNERYQNFSMESHAPTAGLIVDLKLMNNLRRADRSEDNFLFLRTKISYSPLLKSEPFSGGLINIQIGLSGFSRPRKVQYQPRRTTISPPEKLI